MRTDATRPRWRPWIVVVAVVTVAVIATAVTVLTMGTSTRSLPDDRTDTGRAPNERTVTSTTSTTTSIVVERVTLPAGTREYVTVRADRDRVVVRARAPRGWDRSLTPVVTSTDPDPPRSGLDRERVPLPSADRPITGRRVTAVGWEFSNPTSYQPPQPLVFGVVERQGDWIRVQLPVRPNGTTGWLRAENGDVSRTTRSVQISLPERRLRVLDAGTVLMDVPAGVGRPATPTPTGTFTVTDLVPSTVPTGGYGPIALALDGYSEVMDRFGSANDPGAPEVGVPVLAIHGTNRPSSVGRAQSNGCPRLFNDDVVRLAAMVTPGTPVQIWP